MNNEKKTFVATLQTRVQQKTASNLLAMSEQFIHSNQLFQERNMLLRDV